METARKLEQKERFTYEDMLTWDDDVRYELFNGVPIAMSPPLTKHQDILIELTIILGGFLKGKQCKLFIAPSDVLFEDDYVFQPDLYVLCDKSKRHDRGCKGAPDLVIEILSPSTARVDMLEKYNVYLKNGVKEYWIVDPEYRVLKQFILENSKYVHNVYSDTDTVSSQIIEGLKVNLKEVFESND